MFKKDFIFVVFLCLLVVLGNYKSTPAQVVINEVYGGGGNSGAPFNQDFVELYNNSSSPVNLTGWSIQYTSATGSSWGSKLNLSGTIPANGYFLIGLAPGTNGSPLPTPDQTGTINMSATSGKIALVNSTANLTSVTCPTDSTIVDFVGYGVSANCWEGGGTSPTGSGTNFSAPQISNTTSDQRLIEGLDTNFNSDDFSPNTPTPRNSGYTPPTITDVADQTIATPGGSVTGITFTATGSSPLNVSIAADNTSVITSISPSTFSGASPLTGSFSITSGTGGVATVTVTLTDSLGTIVTDTFVVFVGPQTTCDSLTPVLITPTTSGSFATDGGIRLYVSSQTDNATTADGQDDAWLAYGASLGLTSVSGPTGLNGSNRQAEQTISFPSSSQSFAVSTREMTSGANSPPCKGANISFGKTIASNNTSLQQGSPRPAVLASGVYSYSEVLGGLSASTGFRNALLFEFSSPLRAFGAWFGDVESRAAAPQDTRALVRLFDSSGNRIGNDFIIEETAAPYGDRRTRWIGFVSNSANVKSMLVIVGDDDAFTPFAPFYQEKSEDFLVTNGAGFSEHLSFVGATALFSPTAAEVSIGGQVLTPQGLPIKDAIVTFTDSETSETKTFRTNNFGFYRINGIQAGSAQIVNVHHRKYSFSRFPQIISITEDLQDLNLISDW
jgi:hypothetical protein